jgi:hypothetical protein
MEVHFSLITGDGTGSATGAVQLMGLGCLLSLVLLNTTLLLLGALGVVLLLAHAGVIR